MVGDRGKVIVVTLLAVLLAPISPGFAQDAEPSASASLARSYVKRADELYAKGNYESAVVNYLASLKYNRADAGAQYSLGHAYRKYGQPQKAEKAFMAAIAIQPDYGEAYYNLACLYAVGGRTRFALGALNRAMEINRRKFAPLAQADPDFKNLHNDPDFRKIMDAARRF